MNLFTDVIMPTCGGKMRVPSATYRVQLTPDFGFRALKQVIPYLSELGITDLYASPVFRARKGSTHGYDVVDPCALNPELGTRREFDLLFEELKKHDMGWIQDIVPNHMAFHQANHMLADVLENGPLSRFFRFFDVDWEHAYGAVKGRVLAPFLGTFYREALENGNIRLSYESEGFRIRYYDTSFPLNLRSYPMVLKYRLDHLKAKLGVDDPDYARLFGIVHVLQALPEEGDVEERTAQARFIKGVLWELYKRNPTIREFVLESVAAHNGTKGRSESYDLMDRLLARQFFRLSFWKVATEEINYRRFFTINELISLRLEEPEVLETTHALILKLVGEGKFTGIRVDHIDGLYDPSTYLEEIRKRIGDLYLVVEKILEPDEELCASWPVQGTTGYDFLNQVNGLFCKQDNKKKFKDVYGAFTQVKGSFEDVVYEKKKLILGKRMAGDLDNLALLFKELASRDRHGYDITIYGIRRVLMEVLAYLPVYRTYIRPGGISETDRAHVRAATGRALRANPELAHEIRFLERFLLLEFGDGTQAEYRDKWVRFVMRFQQLSGPLMAKGLEDTALYVYNRLLSLNEVGGFPGSFGVSLSSFHEAMAARALRWPHTMNATATHDTKRGEDVRARLNVLSEMPAEWSGVLRSLKEEAPPPEEDDDTKVPDDNDRYFFLQTVLGARPFLEEDHDSFGERVKEYVIKSVREAKVHTNWLSPDLDYEKAFLEFVEASLRGEDGERLQESLADMGKVVSHWGVLNSLAQTLIKLTAPGVPDIYQGTELWDLSLVDPDNRRPVDYAKRHAMLKDLKERREADAPTLCKELSANLVDGGIKLYVIHKALEVRKEFPSVFMNGRYVPGDASGLRAEHVVSYAREIGGTWIYTVVPRFCSSWLECGKYPLGKEGWEDTALILPSEAPKLWRNRFTGETVSSSRELSLSGVIRRFPVALLVGTEDR